jgi:hypothetical protein
MRRIRALKYGYGEGNQLKDILSFQKKTTFKGLTERELSKILRA